jgi:hypothetical protein
LLFFTSGSQPLPRTEDFKVELTRGGVAVGQLRIAVEMRSY